MMDAISPRINALPRGVATLAWLSTKTNWRKDSFCLQVNFVPILWRTILNDKTLLNCTRRIPGHTLDRSIRV